MDMDREQLISEKDLEQATGGSSVPAGGSRSAQPEQMYRCRSCHFQKSFKRMIGAKWACPMCGDVMERVKE